MEKQELSRRSFLGMATVMTAGAVLAACAPSAPETEEPAPEEIAEPAPATEVPAAEKVSVSFMVPGSETEDADFAPVFEEFNKMYDNIEGVYAPAGTGYGPQYSEKLLTMLAGGVAPDTFKTLFPHFGSLAEKGVYVPLDDYVAAYPDITYFDDFFENHLEASTYKGQLLALPNDGAPEGMWYNVDLFDEAGLDYPDWDWTWDTWTDAAKALTKKEGDITVQHGLGRPDWRVHVWSNGGNVLSEDGTKCLLDSPEAIEALTWMQDIVVKHEASPGPEALAELNVGDRFQTGRLGAYYCVRGCLGGLRTIEDFQFDAAPMLTNNEGKRITYLAIGWTSIWEGSEHPDEAYQLAAWICSPEGQRLRISRGYAHPSRKSLVEQEWYREYECPKCNSHGVNTVFPDMLARQECRGWPAHPKDAEIIQVINTQLDHLWDNSKSPEQVGQDMTSEIDALL